VRLTCPTQPPVRRARAGQASGSLRAHNGKLLVNNVTEGHSTELAAPVFAYAILGFPGGAVQERFEDVCVNGRAGSAGVPGDRHLRQHLGTHSANAAQSARTSKRGTPAANRWHELPGLVLVGEADVPHHPPGDLAAHPYLVHRQLFDGHLERDRATG
jgi:hypothetical protein